MLDWLIDQVLTRVARELLPELSKMFIKIFIFDRKVCEQEKLKQLAWFSEAMSKIVYQVSSE